MTDKLRKDKTDKYRYRIREKSTQQTRPLNWRHTDAKQTNLGKRKVREDEVARTEKLRCKNVGQVCTQAETDTLPACLPQSSKQQPA